ncbi:cytochrome P450 [Cystobasidium minutum MCA 4210]|uniref:cytochrome P450 n=1 Tax=Cystobasidium minutum MCA 4210 TaxID=1397322 RepID=UPI0034CDB0BD|eukprot:jgi/Rhomi1/60117/CE60116_1831
MASSAIAGLGLDGLPWPMLLWTVFFTLAIYSTWKIWIYPEYFSPIRNYPGPPVEAWFLGEQRKVFADETGKLHKQWFKKYGPLIQYRTFAGEQVIATSDPKAISYMLMQKTNTFPKPHEEVRGLERLTGRGLLTVEGDIHRRQRKIMSPSFTQLQTNTYLPIMTEQAEKLAECLDKVIDSEKTANDSTLVNMCNWLSRCTLEVISIAGFDYKVGSLERDNHELIDAFNLMLRPRPLTPLLFLTIRLINKMPILAKLPFPGIKAAKASMALMQEEAKAMLGKKLEMIHTGELEDKKDLLSCIVKANKLATSEKDRMKDEEIMGTVATFLLAGHETSSTALTFLLHLLSLHKDVQDKLRKEVQEAYRTAEQEGRSSLTADDLSSLAYLDAVVRETLRVLPPVPMTIREATQDEILPLSEPIKGKDGQMISEVFVPAGCTVAIDITVVNLHKEIFGDDAEVFRPERWLENEGELHKLPRAFCAWTPILSFLGGPRGCIGYRFAVMEIKAITSVLVNKFEFSPGPDPVTFRTNIVARPVLENKLQDGVQLPLYIRKAAAV